MYSYSVNIMNREVIDDDYVNRFKEHKYSFIIFIKLSNKCNNNKHKI